MLVLAGCVTTQTQKPKNKEVAATPPLSQFELEMLQLEGERRTADGALTKLVQSAAEPAQRARALVALARIQDLSTLPIVLAALKDKETSVRAQAAVSTGLMALAWQGLGDAQKTEVSTALNEAEATESQAEVRAAILEALGRLANPAAVQRLTERLSGDELQKNQALLSLGIAAKRGATLPAAVLATATEAVISKNDTTRYVAAYMLMQAKAPGAREGLLRALADTNSETRALGLKGLGDVGTDADVPALAYRLHDADYRVASEATRSLTKLAIRCFPEKPAVKGQPAPPPVLTCAALDALSALKSSAAGWLTKGFSSTAMPLLVLAQAGLPRAAVPLLKDVRVALKTQLDQKSKEVVVKASANLDCRLAAAIDRAQGFLSEVFHCGDDKVPESHWLALGLSELSQAKPEPGKGKARSAEALPYLSHPDAKVRAAAVAAVASGEGPKAVEALTALLTDKDVVMVSSAASGLAQMKSKASFPAVLALARQVPSPELAPGLASALADFANKDAVPVLTTWLTSANAVVRHSAAETLSKLQGKPVSAAHVAHAAPATLSDGWQVSAVEVKTEKGPFTLRLYGHAAPRTVANFVDLAKKGYFKDITFHRVVPNFVVQGGDPRGDGEGGPGYTIPCEINENRYLRGTVGMALSGKDTGGSQWFVATSAQPHLDGRYTTFGGVVSGIEVVDALLEGDRILDVVPVMNAGPITGANK